VSHLRIPQALQALGGAGPGQARRHREALDIMLEGPIGAAAFTTSSGGRTCALFPQLRIREPRHTSDHARGRNRSIDDRHTAKALFAPGLPHPARRPGLLIGWARRGSSMGRGLHTGRPGLRFRAARPTRDAAARPGGDRPLLAARRGEPDPVIHDVARAACRSGARDRACRERGARVQLGTSHRGQRHVAAGDLVQRGAGAIRSCDSATEFTSIQKPV